MKTICSIALLLSSRRNVRSFVLNLCNSKLTRIYNCERISHLYAKLDLGDGVSWASGDQVDDSDERSSPQYNNFAGHGSTIENVSQEYLTLVQKQFGLLVTVLDVSRCALGFRKENPETGSLEFVTVAVYPPKKRVWFVDEDGTSETQEGLLELPGFISAEALLPQYPFISVITDNDGTVTTGCVLNDDGALTAPLIYGNLAIGMLTVWKDIPSIESNYVRWSHSDKILIEQVASSLAVAAAIDHKQHFATSKKMKEIRRLISETLHQAKNPLTALRTFGKLLLRRLPDDESINRELAEDIIVQSNRLVDLLLPVDSAVQALSTTQSVSFLPFSYAENNAGEYVAEQRASIWQTGRDVKGLVFVQDAIEPVLRAAEAMSHAHHVVLKYKVDDDLPGVYGNERALHEIISNLIENSLKYMSMRSRSPDFHPLIFVRAKLSSNDDWGEGKGVILSVCDNGPGINHEELPNVFDRGYRGTGPQKHGIPGSGLGLGIVRDIVESIGGEISLSNRREALRPLCDGVPTPFPVLENQEKAERK